MDLWCGRCGCFVWLSDGVGRLFNRARGPCRPPGTGARLAALRRRERGMDDEYRCETCGETNSVGDRPSGLWAEQYLLPVEADCWNCSAVNLLPDG